MNSKIPYTKPSITQLEISYAADAAANGWGDRCYEYISRFEQQFAEHLGVNHAIATSSCTGALHIGLSALGVGPGDEVILADTNWIATAAPITYLKAKPVLVDVLPDSWCIDPIQVENAITSKTKAVIATHIYGNTCDMDALLSIGDRHGIPIVEDAAEAIGSVYHGKRAGSMGRFGVFSFHGTKTLTTGEGGALVTNEGAFFERALTLSNHGRAKRQTKQFWPDMVGFKYKMSNIQAAIGCAQLERIHELISRKRAIFQYYAKKLRPLRGVSLNPEPHNTVNGYWMPTVVFDRETGVTRELLQEKFKAVNIDARVFFWPLSALGLLDTETSGELAHDLSRRAINLPSHHDITDEQQDRVVDVILDALGTCPNLRQQS